MIKTIYFDFDGVIAITESGGKAASEELSKITGVFWETIFIVFRENGRQFIKGEQDVEDFLNMFSEKIGKKVTKEQLADAYCKIKLSKQVLDLIEKLKENKYSVGLITNNSVFRFNILKERNILDVWSVFDKAYISAEQHEIKQKFIFGIPDFKESVLIDNNLGFLEEVAEKGMKTILFDSMKNDITELVSALKELGIKIS